MDRSVELIFGGLLVVLFALIAFQVWWSATHDCVRGHKSACTGYIYVSDVMVPYSYECTACDEWTVK